MRTLAPVPVLLVAATLAAGCGSGGGSGSRPASASPGGSSSPSSPPPPAVVPIAAVAGPTWTATDLGVAALAAPSVIGDGDRRFVFFQGGNGDLWLLSRDAGATWAAPVDLSVPIASAPSAVSTWIDAARVFFRGASGDLSYTDVVSGVAQAPVDLGGVALASAPSAVWRGGGRFAVFYEGAGGALLESIHDGGSWWSAPLSLGVATANTPCALVPYAEADHLAVLFAGNGGLLRSITFDGASWVAPRDLAIGPVAGGPGGCSWASDEADVFFRDAATGLLAHARLAGGFPVGVPETLGLAIASDPAVLDEHEVVALAQNGHLSLLEEPRPVSFPRLPDVAGIATHNSYWVNRGHLLDPYASGTQECLLDQLLHEHARALEIDVHTDDGDPGVWTIYHTDQPGYSQVHALADLLDMLRAFQHALPAHEAIDLVIELKNTNPDWAHLPRSEPNFLPDHTIDQFDATFRNALGASLFSPRDLLARCAPGSTLARCAAVGAWPTIDRLRGKFIVNLIGNWSSAASDWAEYAGAGPISGRACFPLRSILDDQGGGDVGEWPGSAHAPIAPATLAAARDASIFWQVEDLAYAPVPGFLAGGGIARCGDAFDWTSQRDRLSRGMQLIQTDYPWDFVDDGGPAASGIPTDPSRRFRDPAPYTGRAPIAPAALIEPGLRIYGSTDATRRFAYSLAPAGVARTWETTVSTTRIGETWGTTFPRRAQEGGAGGLMAAASAGEWIEVAREKTGASCDCDLQERVAIRVTVAHGGVASSVEWPVSDVGADALGPTIALEVDGAVARVYSAGRVDAGGNPLWQLLREERFAAPLPYQGVTFTRDVLFAGTRITDAGGAPRGATLCDLASLDGGPATIVDLSWPAPASSCAPVVAPLP